jgi:ribonuclease R
MSRRSPKPRIPVPPPRRERPSGGAAPLPFRPFETFEARFQGFPEGTGGLLRIPNLPKGMDLFVDWRDAGGAIHGDRVQAELAGEGRDGRPRARVIQILSRSDLPLPAQLKRQPWGWQALSMDPRLQQVISLRDPGEAADGDWITVLLEPDPSLAQLKGTMVARLGRPTDLRIENRLTAALYNLPTDFPPAVLEELAPYPTRIPEAWVQGREDLRGILTVTIDPPTARDFDDAISLEVLPREEGGGWLLGVHIADVSHYVPEGGPLDREALRRGTSVYFPDECIPMLPERLSSELCSLQPDLDRLTLSAWMTLSPDLDVVETRFSESVIHSRKRLTYDQVKEACLDLDPRCRADFGEELCGMLDEALRISRKFTARRLGRGALDLDTAETEFIFDEAGKPVDARRYPRHDAHRMIEEFMLLANEAVARHFSRRKLPTIYRIHDEPDSLKLETFREAAAALGILKPREIPTPEVLNAMLERIRGGPLEAMLNTLLVRSLKRAEYSADNIGHSGLALDDYLHFTSPIRRYPDLVVHRLLRRSLRNEPFAEGLHAALVMVARQSSDAEQRATEAERESDKWKTCLLMEDKIGQTFEGHLQGFSPRAAFARLERPFVEVGIPLGGAFEVDEHRTRANGNGGRIVLTLGDPVKVEITAVDMALRRVTAWMLEAQVQDAKGKRIRYVPPLATPTAEASPSRPREGQPLTPRRRPARSARTPKGSVRGGRRG